MKRKEEKGKEKKEGNEEWELTLGFVCWNLEKWAELPVLLGGSSVSDRVVVPPGIRGNSRLALGVSRRPGRDRLGGPDSWVMLPSPGKEVCLGDMFLPNSEVVTCMWYSNIGLWPQKEAA